MTNGLAIDGCESTLAALRETKRRRHPPVCFLLVSGSRQQNAATLGEGCDTQAKQNQKMTGLLGSKAYGQP
jgi:hypothetical protein